METLSSNLIQDCAAGNKSAERELGAFLAAVTELFGADQARRAAEDWLDELELQETFPGDIDWRPITVAAAIRLAQRLHGNPMSIRECRRYLLKRSGRTLLTERMIAEPLMAAHLRQGLLCNAVLVPLAARESAATDTKVLWTLARGGTDPTSERSLCSRAG